MKKQTLYIVNTPNENHFFFSSKEAREDFKAGKRALKEIGETGEIAIYKMPALIEDGESVNFDADLDRYFKANVDTKNCSQILSEQL